MKNQESNSKNEWPDFLKIVGTIIGIPITLFTFISRLGENVFITIIVSLIIAAIASLYVVKYRGADILLVVISWLIMVVISLLIVVVWPQTVSIEGTISDYLGSPIKNKAIVLVDSSGVAHNTTTDEEGYYKFQKIPTGQYYLSVDGIEFNKIIGGWSGLIGGDVFNLKLPQAISTDLAGVTLTISPSPTATETLTITPIHTDTHIPTPTETETSIPTLTATETPTPFGFTQPDNGIRDPTTNFDSIQEITRSTRLEWVKPERIMELQFYRNEQLIKIIRQAKSGDITFDWAPPGLLEIKLWIPQAEEPEDSIFVNVAGPTECAEAKFTSPDGIRDVDPNPDNLPKLEKNNTLILWFPLDCKMIVEFYQHGNAINRFQEVLPGEVDLSWMAVLGQTEVKIWLPGSTSFVTDAMQINVVASP